MRKRLLRMFSFCLSLLMMAGLIAPLEVLAQEQNDMPIPVFGMYGSDGTVSSYGLIDDGYEPAMSKKSDYSLMGQENLPNQYTSPYVTEIKDQNPYGTCWTFSTAAIAEGSAIKEQIAEAPDYSEFFAGYTVYHRSGINDPLGNTSGDYMDAPGESQGYWYEKGGNLWYTSLGMIGWQGVVTEQLYPYEEVLGSISAQDYYQSEAHLQEVETYNAYDLSAIKAAIMKYGSVGASYYHCGSYSYHNPNLYYPKKVTSNHAVTLVGWDDEYSPDNFTQSASKPANKGAWLMKNSWGVGAGNNGYYWISYEDATLGDIYAFRMESKDNYQHNFYLDGGFSGYYFGLKEWEYIANVYTNHLECAQDIEAVGVYLYAIDAACEAQIYLNPSVGNPMSGVPLLEEPARAYFKYAGYHTIPVGELKTAVQPGDTFSVVFKIVLEDENQERPGACADTTTGNFHATQQAGTSYIGIEQYNGIYFHDISEQNEATFRIHAYTNDVIPPAEEPTDDPEEEDSSKPGEEPTDDPEEEDSSKPGEEPTEDPEEEDSSKPDEEPTEDPEEEDSSKPGEEPTDDPEEEDSDKPAEEPEGEKIAINGKDFRFYLHNETFVFDGQPKESGVDVYYKKQMLTEDTDYVISYRNNTDACAAEEENAPTIIIQGINDFEAEKEISFTIEPKQLEQNAATLNITKYEVSDYSAEALKEGLEPAIEVKDTVKPILTQGKDYNVTYTDNHKVGTAGVIVEGCGNYTGQAELSFEIKGIDLAKISFEKIPTQSYANTPCEVAPKISAKTLQKYKAEDILFETVYVNNEIPGTANIYLYAKEGSKTYGSQTLSFKITKAKLTSDAVIVGTDKDANGQLIPEIASVTYDARPQKSEVMVAYQSNGKQIPLTEGVDYTVSYANHTNAGKANQNGQIAASAKVIIKGKGNYSGSVTKYFTILPAQLDSEEGFEIITPPAVKYTGKNVTPKVQITFINSEGKRIALKAGKDYKTVSADKGIKGATAEVQYTIQGMNNFSKSLNKVVTVTDDKIKVTVAKATRTYTGFPIEPTAEEIAVYRGKTLIDPSEYEVSYANNLKAGTASVMIQGADFYGSATFPITPARLVAETNQGFIQVVAPPSVTYSGNAIVFAQDALKIFDNNSRQYLKEGKDYALKYSANVKPGKATVTISGKGNYSGSMKYFFTIERIKAFSKEYIDIETEACIYSAKAQKPKVKVLYYPEGVGKGEGIELKEKSAYTVTYKNHKNAGTASAVVKPKGAFFETLPVKELTHNFRIQKASLAGNGAGITMAAINPQTYKNKPVIPKITLKMNGYTLKQNVDYTVQFTENNRRGIATATITGMGNFEGVRMTKFIIR